MDGKGVRSRMLEDERRIDGESQIAFEIAGQGDGVQGIDTQFIEVSPWIDADWIAATQATNVA